jgi:hypothetical protein
VLQLARKLLVDWLTGTGSNEARDLCCHRFNRSESLSE